MPCGYALPAIFGWQTVQEIYTTEYFSGFINTPPPPPPEAGASYIEYSRSHASLSMVQANLYISILFLRVTIDQ